MIAVIQRVSRAEVRVEGVSVGRIDRGILALVAVERGDAEQQADRLADRILTYRIFPDDQERMNFSLTEIDGDLLLVSQFTLAADTKKGARPSFAPAEPPEEGKRMFEYLVDSARRKYPRVATGSFGANMQVSLVNDGPITFILRVPPKVCNPETIS